MGRKYFWQVLGLFLAIIILPYVFAQLYGGQNNVFGGFLLNPLDGNTYLAKMEEGRQGAWQFTLPFTAEKGSGAFLFMFYLLLGHLSRLAGLSVILTFHLARVLGAAFLAYSLFQYCGWVFENNPKWARRAFALGLLGSGLGWTLLAFEQVTADLWVAEAYPFLSGFANPHFSLGMGLLLQLVMAMARPLSRRTAAGLAVMGLLLAVIMPFGVVVAGVVSGAWLLLEWITTRELRWQAFLAAFCLAGPGLIYQYWAMQSDVLLSRWNAQNVTPAPALWDFVVALSPALCLAIFAIWQIARRRAPWTCPLRLQMAWFVVGVVLIYFPFALQRRFMFGIFVPVALLAVEGLRQILANRPQKIQRRVTTLVWVVSSLTNAMLLVVLGFAALSHSPKIYLTADQIAAFAYIRTAAAADAVVLCDPETGNFIPGWTGRRVLYGHEFETVNAPVQKRLVTDLLADQFSVEESKALLDQNQVQYVYLGSNDRTIPKYLSSMTLVYQNETVKLYRWQ